jgi:plastocyanin
VTIDGTSYRPAVLAVAKGTRVEWRNDDPFPHTATLPGLFDSKSIAAGARWSFAANKVGRHDYICTLHPNMKGTLVVE